MIHTVTLVPGDGVGPEVIRSAQRVLDAAGAPIRWEECHLGNDVEQAARLVLGGRIWHAALLVS